MSILIYVTLKDGTTLSRIVPSEEQAKAELAFLDKTIPQQLIEDCGVLV
jgi:hypothetical protein